MASTPPKTAANSIRNGAKVVDVRPASRHASDGLPGSLSLPLERLEAGEVPAGIAVDQTFFLVCEVGGFSELAAALLQSAGYLGASSVRGGLSALRPLLNEE